MPVPQIPLEEIASLEPFLTPLHKLGYSSLEQVVAASRDNNALARHLGVRSIRTLLTEDELSRLHPPPRLRPNSHSGEGISLADAHRLRSENETLRRVQAESKTVAERYRKARLDSVAALAVNNPALALEALALAVPGTKNLHSIMPPIRNQGAFRETCVAFAVAAAYQVFLGLNAELSEQFLYYACKEIDGDNLRGTTLASAVSGLEQLGCCTADKWGYNFDNIALNEGQGPPPSAASADALTRQLSAGSARTLSGVSEIQQTISDGTPVVATVDYFSFWENPLTFQTGELTMPTPGSLRVKLHAVCLMGYRDNPIDPGGGRFFLRNSRGANWGANSDIGPGYGTIPYQYITDRCDEAYAFN